LAYLTAGVFGDPKEKYEFPVDIVERIAQMQTSFMWGRAMKSFADILWRTSTPTLFRKNVLAGMSGT